MKIHFTIKKYLDCKILAKEKKDLLLHQQM